MPATTVQDSVPEHHRLAKPNGANNGSISPAWIPTQVEDVTLRTTEFSFDTVEDALNAFARGEAIVVMDDERRENEGDLIISASHCSVEAMAWMIKNTRYESFAPMHSVFMSILADISASLFPRSVSMSSKFP